MSNLQIIDQKVLDSVTESARTSARKRKNYNFHDNAMDTCHRLLNAVEPSSYIRPHCHTHPAKDETIIAVRGTFGVILFDEAGNITEKVMIGARKDAIGINIPHHIFHTLVALESGSVFFEAKAGPYEPISPAEKASWSPQEDDVTVAAYLQKMKDLF